MSVQFICPLSRHWPPLLPLASQPHLERVDGLQEQFQLNPRLHLQRPAEPDASGWAQKMAQIHYSAQLPVLWVPHAFLEYPEAYWPDAEILALLQALASGQQRVQDVDPKLFRILVAAHVLTLKSAHLYREKRAQMLKQWYTDWQQQRYVLLPQVISPLQTAALRHYLRQIYAQTPLLDEDDDYTRRKYLYDDPLVRFVHRHLAQILEALLQTEVRPTYCVISYYENTALAPHTDRAPCLWNISLQIDSEPECRGQERWALWLDTDEGAKAIYLNPGDGVLYSGREMPHGREALPPGRRETMLLFHFVNREYQGQMW